MLTSRNLREKLYGLHQNIYILLAGMQKVDRGTFISSIRVSRHIFFSKQFDALRYVITMWATVF